MASKKLIALVAVLGLGFASNTFAAEESSSQSTTIKADELKPKNKVKGEDIDKEITNKKLRAELGSKSKYSMSSSLNYSGSSISKPLDKDRPNITGAAIAPPTSLSGSIKGRYRIDSRSSVSAGIGVSIVQPFVGAQETQGHNSFGDKLDANNPSVSYSYAHKVGGLQMIHGAGLWVATSDYSTGINTQGGISYDNTVLASFGKSGKLQVGLVSVLWTDTFGDQIGDVVTPTGTFENVDVQGLQWDYGVAFYPFVEYVLSDRYNLRTVFRQTSFNHNKSLKAWAVDRSPGSQSVGLGISVTRDVFLYPNFQFSTENLSAEFFEQRFSKESTVGVSATLNVF